MSESVAPQPSAERPLVSRSAPAARGIGWIADGFHSFVTDWPAWLVIASLSLLGSALQLLLPILGTIAVFLCTPVFIGGLMQGLAVERNGGRRLAVADMFSQFSTPALRPLLLIGITWLALVLLSLLAVVGFVTVTSFADVLTQHAQSLEMLVAARDLTFGISLLIGVLIFVALMMPVTMLVWFAPALVVLEGESAGSAMKHSFVGCLRNFMPYLAYGLVGLLVFPLLVLCTLGLGVLVLLPVGLASIHAAYRDIFHRP
ncbi:MAG: BPSS1780 family membrane protein [Pseudomonadota bacterium]